MHRPPHGVQNLDVVLPGEGRVPERSAHPPLVPGFCPWYQWPLLEPAWGSCSRVAVLSGRWRWPQWGWVRDGSGCSWLCSRIVSDLALGHFHVLCIQLPTMEVTPAPDTSANVCCPLFQTIMEQFNPSLRNFISMGKTYEKALASK